MDGMVQVYVPEGEFLMSSTEGQYQKAVDNCLNLPEKIISDARICDSRSPKMMHTGGTDAILKTRFSKSSFCEVIVLVEFIRREISGVYFIRQ
jgi:hypothetical protein